MEFSLLAMNPKGLAFFVLGLLDRLSMEPDNGYAEKAESLLDLLTMNQSPGGTGPVVVGGIIIPDRI